MYSRITFKDGESQDIEGYPTFELEEDKKVVSFVDNDYSVITEDIDLSLITEIRVVLDD